MGGGGWARSVLAALVAVAAVVFFFVVPPVVDMRMNGLFRVTPHQASARARALHARLLVADLHADSLLWGRDLLVRGSRGHVDLPRLAEGNVAFQAFTVVTKIPRGINIVRNDDRTDLITYMALAQRWPVATWTRLAPRALYQARRLHEMAAASNGRLVIVRSAKDLLGALERRRRSPGLVAGLLGLEGAHALDGDLANLDAFFAAGYRMVAPTHFFDDDLGGSAHGVVKGGLTAKGRDMIRSMEEKGMILDLAHASPALITDALAVARRPVVVSHTGVKATCDNLRNLDDDQLRGIARTGGVVGIGYWEEAVCGRDAAAVARAIRHAVDVAGVDHVGLGSDFDGAVAMPFDTAGLAELTDALLVAGLDDDAIGRIMGGNVLRVLAETLP